MSYSNELKFYQPTQAQASQQKMQDIMSRLHNQQSHIMKILQKYKQAIPDLPEPSNKKYQTLRIKEQQQQQIDHHKNYKTIHQRQKIKKQRGQQIKSHRKKNQIKYHEKDMDFTLDRNIKQKGKQIYQLPKIKEKVNRSSRKDHKKSIATPVQSQVIRKLRNRSLQVEQLNNAYNIKPDTSNRQLVRPNKIQKKSVSSVKNSENSEIKAAYTNVIQLQRKQLTQRLSRPLQISQKASKIPAFSQLSQKSPRIFDQQLRKILSQNQQEDIQNQIAFKHQIMKPLTVPIPLNKSKIPQQIRKPLIQSDSDDSNQENVTLKYYARQLDNIFISQCKQQMNFLFFSKTAQMKQWSSEALQLFKKHDQQLSKLHIKNKYLKTFDDAYFTAQIYKYKK